MRIIIDIGHPGHVHFYKNFVWQMRARGHDILITSGDKEVSLQLLDAYNLDYIFTCKRQKGLGLAIELVKRDIQMLGIARRFKPDIITGIHNPVVAHISKLTRAKSITFTDSEPRLVKLASIITLPFSDVICTPSCFSQNLGKKHVRYDGYHEIAYLHPNYFNPDPSPLNDLGLNMDDKFVIMRFGSWQASHDIGQHGLDIQAKRNLVEELSKYARIFITSEGPLPYEFEQYKITARPEMIHNLLYYASLFVGDSSTMATEAAILGTPAIRCNSFVGPNDWANFIELETKYDVLYCFRQPEKAIQKAVELIQLPDLKQQWVDKRQRLLSDKIDVTQFMIDFVENYPESFHRYKDRTRSQ